MSVDRQASISSLTMLASELNLSVDDLADSAIRVAESNIVRAIQQVSTERGRDPRDFTLVPFGGAGPLHAARVAEELEIKTILIPQNAGVLSAAGLLMSDYVHYRSRTRRTAVNAQAIPVIQNHLADLRNAASSYLQQLGVTGSVRCEYILEMRYVGQAFELSVMLPEDLASLTYENVFEAFRAAHHQVFEFSKPPEDPSEIVSFRVGVHTLVEPFPFTSVTGSSDRPSHRSIEIIENGKPVCCQLLARNDIGSSGISGATLIEDGTSTVYVPPHWHCRCDSVGNLIMERQH